MRVMTKCIMGEKGGRRKKQERGETGKVGGGEESREWVEFGSASGKMAIIIPHVSFTERQFVSFVL